MGSHHFLPEEAANHATQVCHLCNTGALGNDRHMLLECPTLAGGRLQFSLLVLSCFSIVTNLRSACAS